LTTLKSNWLDKAYAYVAPVKAAERYKARLAMAGSYTGASRMLRSLANWNVSQGDADSDLLPDLPTLRARCRDLARNQPLAAGALNTVCTHVVGTGLRLQVRLDRSFLGLSDEAADAWAAQTEREFALWAESPDCAISRNLTFYECQELAFRSSLENGDCFVLMPYVERLKNPYSLRLQIIEADRVVNPHQLPDSDTLAGGVQKDKYGAPLAYHILQGHPGALCSAQKNTWQCIPAFGAKTGRRNVLHLYRSLRPGQTRGVPYLAAVIEPFKQLGTYTQAEVMAAVVSAMMTVFVKSPEGDMDLMAGAPTRENGKGGYTLGNGTVVQLAEGEDITTVTPGRPNAAFDPFVQSILRQIGVALELPFEVLVKHFTASYSAARAALLEAWQFFNIRRAWLSAQFCQAVYEEWLTHAVAIGRISAPGFLSGDPLLRAAYAGAVWIGPAPGQIDPLKEIEAAGRRIEIGVSSLARECAALSGIDWETELHQQIKEARLRQAAGFPTTGNLHKAQTEKHEQP
jgi:lambda family phage portal protein